MTTETAPTALAEITAAPLVSIPAEIGPADVVAAFLAGKKPVTIDAYKRDLSYFAGTLGVGSIDEAAATLLGGGQGRANATVLGFRNVMVDAKLAPATINRRLSAVRSLVKVARLMGASTVTIDVGNVKAEAYRDTRGPGADALCGILDHLRSLPDGEKARRDIAMLTTLAHLGIRRAELASLDAEHLDLDRRELWILGKGRHHRERLTVAEPTIDALRPWVEARSDFAPLFYSCNRSTRGARLAGDSVWNIVRSMGARCGVKLHPHAIRHTAITVALDEGAGVREVNGFGRHTSIETTMIYDDKRRDDAGAVSALVAARIG